MQAYTIKNIATGSVFSDRFTDEGFLLNDPNADADSLIQSVYPNTARLDLSKDSFARYAAFIPANRPIPTGSRSVSYHAVELGKKIGMEALYITLSGYVPRLGSSYSSGSFKECEALSVFARMPKSRDSRSLVIASAGNTARAFAHVAELCEEPVIVVIPEQNKAALWSCHKESRFVRVLHVADGDYYDAIRATNILCSFDEFIPEGGAKNIARRDGMGTTMHEAISTIGAIPKHYFQAVGSGTGAIAAHEAVTRRIEREYPGASHTTMHLSQSIPFTLLVDSWNTRQRDLVPLSDAEGRTRSAKIYAPVLANRHPAYSIIGGVFDTLQKTKGHMYAISSKEAKQAQEEFSQSEGYDIDPAAAVAYASVKQAIQMQRIQESEICMLNITGAGYQELFKTFAPRPLSPNWVISAQHISRDALHSLLLQ